MSARPDPQLIKCHRCLYPPESTWPFVLPSKGFAPSEEFEGATVFEPTRGVRENVVVLDLTSLYPMAMMTVNASPETKDLHGELKAPNGVRFRGKPDGLTRSIISELMNETGSEETSAGPASIGIGRICAL